MLASHIDTIIFDFGGVLLNLNKQACVSAFAELGCDIAPYMDNYRQKGLFLLFEEGKISNDEFFRELKKIVGKHCTDEDIMWAYKQFLTDLPQEKLELILRLHQRYRIFLFSNINQFVFDYCRQKYFETQGHTLSDFFDKTYLSFQMGVCKPDERIFRQMIEDAAIDPRHCFYLDDSTANIEAGMQLGFNCYQPKMNENFSFLFE
ncbi:MAG: HAD family phosphatase [Bacteroidales bacterium]|nr:HAD family phosphatase [Bacteroidales bacterium]